MNKIDKIIENYKRQYIEIKYEDLLVESGIITLFIKIKRKHDVPELVYSVRDNQIYIDEITSIVYLEEVLMFNDLAKEIQKEYWGGK